MCGPARRLRPARLLLRALHAPFRRFARNEFHSESCGIVEDRHEQLFGRQRRAAVPAVGQERRRARASTAARSRVRRWAWIAGLLGTLAVSGVVAARSVDAWLRPRLE